MGRFERERVEWVLILALIVLGLASWGLCWQVKAGLNRLRDPWSCCGKLVYVMSVLVLISGLLALRRMWGFFLPVYVAGYAFATFIAFVPVARLLQRVWDKVPRDLHPSPTIHLPWKGLLLGIVEGSLYVTALLLRRNGYTLIAAWLVLKVAGNWNYWSSSKGGKLYDFYLVGVGLSLAYAVVGWQIVLVGTNWDCPNAFPPAYIWDWLRLPSASMWAEMVRYGGPVALLATLVAGGTILAYSRLGEKKGVEARLAVLFTFIDGTQEAFGATLEIIGELRNQQEKREPWYCLGDPEHYRTIRASQVREWRVIEQGK